MHRQDIPGRICLCSWHLEGCSPPIGWTWHRGTPQFRCMQTHQISLVQPTCWQCSTIPPASDLQKLGPGFQNTVSLGGRCNSASSVTDTGGGGGGTNSVAGCGCGAAGAPGGGGVAGVRVGAVESGDGTAGILCKSWPASQLMSSENPVANLAPRLGKKPSELNSSTECGVLSRSDSAPLSVVMVLTRPHSDATLSHVPVSMKRA